MPAPVILYDGSCGFCARSVQFVLRHDRRGFVRFAALQGAFAADVRRRHPGLAAEDSMVWVEYARAGVGMEQERILLRSEAALAIARYLGGIWRVAGLLRVLPRRWRDGAYALVARHRHRWSMGGAAECLVPSETTRARFLA